MKLSHIGFLIALTWGCMIGGTNDFWTGVIAFLSLGGGFWAARHYTLRAVERMVLRRNSIT